MTTTPTSGAADLLTLIEAYAEARLRQGHSSYNAQTAAALQAVKDELAAGQATAAPAQPAAQQGVAYAELPDLSDANGEIWSAIIYWKHAKRGEDALRKASELERVLSDQMRAFADATHALRASHGQAPASVLHLVHSAFAEIAMAFPKAFALHKVGIADKAVLEALAAPAGAQADNKKKDPTMSFHNKPDYHIPELIEALKAHRLPHDTPSQLADSFRIGWMACRELAQATAAQAAQVGAVESNTADAAPTQGATEMENLQRTAVGWQGRALRAERNWAVCRRWAIAGGAPVEKLGDDPDQPFHAASPAIEGESKW